MGKIAFVFSGQGAQYPGMGRSLYENSPAARAVFEMADRVRPGTAAQCFEADGEVLSKTENTQPCVFAVDLAAAAAAVERGIQPECAAGFSLGEVAAVGFAGILSYEEAFRLVCRRAEWMAAAASHSPGAMVAVLKLPANEVERLCAGLEEAWPVNYNCPGQTVVAVREDLAEQLCAMVKEAGGRAKRLAVSGAFHSPYMEPAARCLAEYLAEIPFSAPKIPVYSNVTAMPYGADGKNLLARQCKSPVLWQKTVETLCAEGVDTFVEVGVGKTLAGLVQKTNSQAKTFPIQNKEELEAAAAVLGDM
jgi:[acyl-carrier-protein] S-malonyltransferase